MVDFALKNRYVIYVRVSKRWQADYGWSQEAQEGECRKFIRHRDGVECGLIVCNESGGEASKQRSLQEALRLCREQKATLLVSVMDRLSRDAVFLMSLWKSDHGFAVATMPNLTDLTVGMMAVYAQHERQLCSARTKAGLARAKESGVKLGAHNKNRKVSTEARARIQAGANAAHKAKAKVRAEERLEKCRKLLDTILPLYMEPGSSMSRVADILNERKVPTIGGKGGKWVAARVAEVLNTAAPNMKEQIRRQHEDARAAAIREALEASRIVPGAPQGLEGV